MDDRRLTPGQEGSDEAVATLLLLHRTTPTGGSTLDDLIGLLQMPKTTLQQALKGLWARGRVRTEGRTTGARWRVSV